MSKTLLIDGNNLVFRVFHVAESLTGGKDQGLLHVHLCINSLKTYCEIYRPDKIICCWDKRASGEDNLRKTILPEYKGNRDKDQAEKIHCEAELIEELMEYLGVTNFYPNQLEADDCIAYLCHTLEGEKIIVSSDKDLLQLINSDVVFYDAMKKTEVNLRNFESVTGYTMMHFLIAKAFAGDGSDNVPGIKGFGPVKTKRYLNGEIELTEEQKKQLNFNMHLFDLNFYKSQPTELAHYQSQAITRKPQWDKFLRLCEERGLQNILKNKEAYYNLFCMEQKLVSTLATLFG